MKNRLIFVCFLFSVFFSFADEKKQTVCVNMIVKNESKVIERCLQSVLPIIDRWVIVDTGSTDGTQEIIKKFMSEKNVPGELYETPWVNFEFNRNDALQRAKGKADYLLIIDADEVLAFADDFKMPVLDKDFYFIITKFGGTEYGRVQLIKSPLNWIWIGVVHEALNSSEAITSDTLKGVNNVVHTDGARSSDPLKYQKDALAIEEALKKEPGNTRYLFYLAQSWKDAGEYQKALDYYQKRIDAGGWQEEIFWSMLQIGHLQKALGMDPKIFLGSYYKAYHYRNTRPEPLFYIANHHRTNGEYAQGYLIAEAGLDLPVSKDLLFVEKSIYDYGFELELSICAYWLGKYKTCSELSEKILKKPGIPENVRECVERNLACSRTKLLELYAPEFHSD